MASVGIVICHLVSLNCRLVDRFINGQNLNQIKFISLVNHQEQIDQIKFVVNATVQLQFFNDSKRFNIGSGKICINDSYHYTGTWYRDGSMSLTKFESPIARYENDLVLFQNGNYKPIKWAEMPYAFIINVGSIHLAIPIAVNAKTQIVTIDGANIDLITDDKLWLVTSDLIAGRLERRVRVYDAKLKIMVDGKFIMNAEQAWIQWYGNVKRPMIVNRQKVMDYIKSTSTESLMHDADTYFINKIEAI